MSRAVRVHRPSGLDTVEYRNTEDIRYRFEIEDGCLVILALATNPYNGMPSTVAAFSRDAWLDAKYV